MILSDVGARSNYFYLQPGTEGPPGYSADTSALSDGGKKSKKDKEEEKKRKKEEERRKKEEEKERKRLEKLEKDKKKVSKSWIFNNDVFLFHDDLLLTQIKRLDMYSSIILHILQIFSNEIH